MDNKKMKDYSLTLYDVKLDSQEICAVTVNINEQDNSVEVTRLLNSLTGVTTSLPFKKHGSLSVRFNLTQDDERKLKDLAFNKLNILKGFGIL